MFNPKQSQKNTPKLNSKLNSNPETGKLYIAATPIGNLSDVTQRFIDTAQAIDIILCENINHSKKLLNRLLIVNKTLLSLNKHNEQTQTRSILNHLNQGKNVMLISDAGTPLIQDPGYQLVKTCIDNGIQTIAIPGCCAFVSALVVSGLPPYPALFAGFIPTKAGDRQRFLKSYKRATETIIFYASQHRIVKEITDIKQTIGEQRQLVLVKELTKINETVIRGNADNLLHWLASDPRHHKGEFVLLMQGDTQQELQDTPIENDINALSLNTPSDNQSSQNSQNNQNPQSTQSITPELHLIPESSQKNFQRNFQPSPLSHQCMQELLAHLPLKTAAKITAKITNQNRQDLYKYYL